MKYFVRYDTTDGEGCSGCGGGGVANVDDVAVNSEVKVVEQFTGAVTRLCANTGTTGLKMLCFYLWNEFLQCADKCRLAE